MAGFRPLGSREVTMENSFIKNVFKSNFRHVARIPVASGSDQLCLAGSRVWSSNNSFSTLPGVTCCHT